MKNLYIIGNWKSNKTTDEAIEWLRKLKIKTSNFKLETAPQVVLCVPFTLLHAMKQRIKQLQIPIELGAQDVSPFDEGAYTGEVNAKQVKELADWVIIGHSERRRFFLETDEMLCKKAERAQQSGLRIIYCVPDEETLIFRGADVVAYEPVWAIGSGKADTPQNANHVVTSIKQHTGGSTVIYGGSVTPENIISFVSQPAIDGVLPGGTSLDAEKFAKLIETASTIN